MKHAAGLILAIVAAPAAAQMGPEQPDHARARLACEQAAVVPGETFNLGLHFDIDEHWHIYWDGWNDSGYPPHLELDLPEGFVAGEMQWPAPKRHITGDGEILDHVYEGSVTLIVPVRAPRDLSVGESVVITGSAEWLVCRTACVPGANDDLKIELPIGYAAGESDDAPLFARARRRVPKPVSEDPRVDVQRRGDRLEVLCPKASGISFYPAADCADPIDAVGEGESRGPRLSMRFDPDKLRTKPIKGVLEVLQTSPTGFETRVYSVELPPG